MTEKQLEKKLKSIYQTAEKEIGDSWIAFMQEAEQKIKPLEEAYEKAKQSGDKDAIRKAGIALNREKTLQTVQNKRFAGVAGEVALRLANINEVALDYVNGVMPEFYSAQLNEVVDQIYTDIGQIDTGRNFSLMDENTFRNLLEKKDQLYSQKTLDRAKDMKWNLKAITSQMTQGILQGESIPKMAQRLQNITSMNEAAAVRSARTLVTTAENSGRLSGLKAAEEMGIVYEKQWMASHDDRTRLSHQELDGVSVPVDEPFIDGDGNKIMYPGDMTAAPETVWNCRCTMVRKLIGFRRPDGTISKVDIKHPYKPRYF